MEYVKGIDAYYGDKPTAITFGKFDGLHQGHELLISRVIEHQQKDGVASIVFAFDMMPLYEKLNIKPDFLLTNAEKASMLEDRIDYFIDCPFDEQISSVEAETFIKQIVVGKFHARYVIVGKDFRFGHNKRGDYRMLQEYGSKLGFEVEVYDKKCYGEREISSSYIKEELKKGNISLAKNLLGYDYRK